MAIRANNQFYQSNIFKHFRCILPISYKINSFLNCLNYGDYEKANCLYQEIIEGPANKEEFVRQLGLKKNIYKTFIEKSENLMREAMNKDVVPQDKQYWLNIISMQKIYSKLIHLTAFSEETDKIIQELTQFSKSKINIKVIGWHGYVVDPKLFICLNKATVLLNKASFKFQSRELRILSNNIFSKIYAGFVDIDNQIKVKGNVYPLYPYQNINIKGHQTDSNGLSLHLKDNKGNAYDHLTFERKSSDYLLITNPLMLGGYSDKYKERENLPIYVNCIESGIAYYLNFLCLSNKNFFAGKIANISIFGTTFDLNDKYKMKTQLNDMSFYLSSSNIHYYLKEDGIYKKVKKVGVGDLVGHYGKNDETLNPQNYGDFKIVVKIKNDHFYEAGSTYPPTPIRYIKKSKPINGYHQVVLRPNTNLADLFSGID